MSAVATRQRDAPTLFPEAGGEPGLDERLVRAWEGLIAHRPVDCPVCGAEMRPDYGAHALPIGGRCRACGATLA